MYHDIDKPYGINGASSNVAIGVVNTSEACEVLDIKVPFDLC
jgi:hypothetical protein